MLVKCPHCQNEHEVEVNAAAIMGQSGKGKKKTMTAEAIAARQANGKKGGRPVKPKADATE